MQAAWLLRDGDVLASAEIADSRVERGRGLLGYDTYEGAMYLPGTTSVHTLFMRFPIDVVFLDREFVVLDIVTVPTFRVTKPRKGTKGILEAAAGSAEKWGLVKGDHVEIRRTES